ncbi:MAG: LacI family transcriptional regulator, partial [Clostridiales bacterium]|nr:LacI family transcriptional regulator [Clostridiales bacterium]
HLLANVHTRIGLILGNRGIYTTEKRYEGYLRALNAKDVEPQDDLLIYSDYTMEGGYNSTTRLLSLDPPPSAIFVTNYEMTIGTILALNESRVAIPDDISLIGFDKLDLFSAIYRNLALVKQPQTSIGEMVAKQLLSMLAGGPDANNQNSTIMLTSQLFTGETVKPYHGVGQGVGQDEAPGVLQKN